MTNEQKQKRLLALACALVAAACALAWPNGGGGCDACATHGPNHGGPHLLPYEITGTNWARHHAVTNFLATNKSAIIMP